MLNQIKYMIINKYCNDNNINLLRIKYDENINSKLYLIYNK